MFLSFKIIKKVTFMIRKLEKIGTRVDTQVLLLDFGHTSKKVVR